MSKAISSQVFELLEPGGVFANFEHVASPTERLHLAFYAATRTTGREGDVMSVVPDDHGERLSKDGTDRILGAHLLHDRAEEIIIIFALAIRTGLGAHDLKEMVFTYPTTASDIAYML